MPVYEKTLMYSSDKSNHLSVIHHIPYLFVRWTNWLYGENMPLSEIRAKGIKKDCLQAVGSELGRTELKV
jgi:hypothetical protein